MSEHAFSRESMRRIALVLSEDELYRNYRVACMKTHKCNFCFNCVCKEVYTDLKLCKDLIIDIELWG